MVTNKKEAQASALLTPLDGGKPSRTIYSFLNATDNPFREFMLWKQEQLEYEIELYGRVIPLAQVNFLEWLEWLRIDSLNLESEDLTIEAAFEEVF